MILSVRTVARRYGWLDQYTVYGRAERLFTCLSPACVLTDDEVTAVTQGLATQEELTEKYRTRKEGV